MRLPRRTALVTVGFGALAFAMIACRPAPAPPSGKEAIAAAVGDTLPFESRLSGGFVPSKKGPTRAAGDHAVDLSPDARIAIAQIEKRAIDLPTPDVMADLGVAYLVQGDIDRAITMLDDAASQLNAAAPWSDLSAAYLAKAERTPARKIELLSRALEAAEKSLKASRTNDALFNRALAREGLARYAGLQPSWSEYIAAETNAAWKDAASRRAATIEPPLDTRAQWEARRKELRAKLAAKDQSFVTETVRLFPEAATEVLEREIFVDPTAIDSAAMLASAIFAVTRDPMTRDEVTALRSNVAAISRGHIAYADGIKRYETGDYPGAQQSYSRALADFAAAGAPYRAWAEQQLALIDWAEGRFEEAGRRMERVERAATPAGYKTLLARMFRQRGEVLKRQWRLTESLAALKASAASYESANEQESAVSVYAALADALRMLGESSDSWMYIGRTLEDLHRLRRPINRYLLLYNAALFAGRLDLHDAALLFQEAAVREAQSAGPGVFTEATIQHALVNVRRGDTAAARIDTRRAAELISTATSPDFKMFADAELAVVRAQLGDDSTASNLEKAIAFFSGRDPGRLPALYLLLARTPQARTDRRTAEDALRRGIDTLENQQTRLGDEALRISFFDESWGLFQDMVALQAAAHNPAGAFEYAERSRARVLTASRQGTAEAKPKSLSEIQASLPDASQLVLYSALPDRLLIWTVSRSNTTFVERPTPDRELARLVDAHRTAITSGRDNRDANNRLYAAVVEPIASVIKGASLVVLVPDGALHQLAFATLRDPLTNKFLIEDHALLVTPSASFFAGIHARSTGQTGTALLIGNPAANGVRALPGAEREAAAVAALYSNRELLLGPQATKQRFLQSAPRADVIHFGGHALVNTEFPLLSRLVFADEDHQEQSLYAHEIARMQLPHTRVVVLAACSTAAGAISRGEGVVSVARPFLASGVPTVIASQWDVDDSATEQLTLNFHRALTTSRDPIKALHTAQLAMLRSGDASWALPQSWGAFVAIGTAVQ